MFQFKRGARLKAKVDPNIVGGEINRLCKQYGGRVGAEQVVNAARIKSNPLHVLFDWKDSEAAGKWRLHQARMLLCFVVRVEKHPDTGQEFKVRQYVVTNQEEDGMSYEPIVEVMSDEERREDFLAQALEELEDWQERYENFLEFSRIIEVIRQTKKRIRRKEGEQNRQISAAARV